MVNDMTREPLLVALGALALLAPAVAADILFAAISRSASARSR